MKLIAQWWIEYIRVFKSKRVISKLITLLLYNIVLL